VVILIKPKTDNDTYLERFHYPSQTYIKDINQSNHFVYDEKIGGIYANAEKLEKNSLQK
jgi:hypothetical protein